MFQNAGYCILECNLSFQNARKNVGIIICLLNFRTLYIICILLCFTIFQNIGYYILECNLCFQYI